MHLRNPYHFLLSNFFLCTGIAFAQGGHEEAYGTLHAPSTGNFFGAEIVQVGDVDADGTIDFAVSSVYDARIMVYSGRTLLVLQTLQAGLSPESGTRLADLGDIDGDGIHELAIVDRISALVQVYSIATGLELYQVTNTRPTSAFGRSLANIGDIDADGIADFAVGAHWRWVNGEREVGTVYIYSGIDGSLIHEQAGTIRDGWFGTEVHPAGDYNFDGTPDYLVVSLEDASSLNNQGVIQVFDGTNYTELLRMTGRSHGSGNSMDAILIGDADGDGLSDFGITEPSYGTSGPAYFSIRSGATGQVLTQAFAETAAEPFADAIVPAGDVDGDGLADILLGVGGPTSSGQQLARFFSGRTGSVIGSFEGTSPLHADFGDCLEALGDLDGDGREEFAVGDLAYASNDGAVFVRSFHPLLECNVWQVSASAGGTLDLQLDFPTAAAGVPYRVGASFSGIGPLQVGAVEVPLSMDSLLRSMISGAYPFSAYSGLDGTLDAQGQATASIAFAPGEIPVGLVGGHLGFAAVALQGGSVEWSSIAWVVEVQP